MREHQAFRKQVRRIDREHGDLRRLRRREGPYYHYMLRGRRVVPVEVSTTAGLLKWGRSFERANRQLCHDVMSDGTVVSTVFLGIDHGYSAIFSELHDANPHLPRPLPTLFETMVFPPGYFARSRERWAAYRAGEELPDDPRDRREYQARYCTLDEAEAGHAHVVEIVKFMQAQGAEWAIIIARLNAEA